MRQLRSPLLLLALLVSAADARALIPGSAPKPSPSVGGLLVSGYRVCPPRFAEWTSGDPIEQEAALNLLPFARTNALNQYTSRTLSDEADILALAYAAATNVSVNGQTADHRKVEYYWKKLAVSNGSVLSFIRGSFGGHSGVKP